MWSFTGGNFPCQVQILQDKTAVLIVQRSQQPPPHHLTTSPKGTCCTFVRLQSQWLVGPFGLKNYLFGTRLPNVTFLEINQRVDTLQRKWSWMVDWWWARLVTIRHDHVGFFHFPSSCFAEFFTPSPRRAVTALNIPNAASPTHEPCRMSLSHKASSWARGQTTQF